MPLGDPADVRKRVRRQHGDRHAGPLGGGPQPVERPIGQPAPHRLLKKPIAQAEHARLAPPRIDEGALVRLIQREGAEDREAARKVPHRLEGHLGGVGVPARRVDHGGIDAALVHQAQRLLGCERGDLAMGHVAGQTATPEMDLSIHDAHHAPPSSSTRCQSSHPCRAWLGSPSMPGNGLAVYAESRAACFADRPESELVVTTVQHKERSPCTQSLTSMKSWRWPRNWGSTWVRRRSASTGSTSWNS